MNPVKFTLIAGGVGVRSFKTFLGSPTLIKSALREYYGHRTSGIRKEERLVRSRNNGRDKKSCFYMYAI